MVDAKRYIHKKLASGRWYVLSFAEQMANIGSDVNRALMWKERGANDSFDNAVMRALELLELTISDDKNHTYGRLKELTRMKELLLDYFYNNNTYNSTAEFFKKYFDAFAFALARRKEKKV